MTCETCGHQDRAHWGSVGKCRPSRVGFRETCPCSAFVRPAARAMGRPPRPPVRAGEPPGPSTPASPGASP